jgi:hypothetical protein
VPAPMHDSLPERAGVHAPGLAARLHTAGSPKRTSPPASGRSPLASPPQPPAAGPAVATRQSVTTRAADASETAVARPAQPVVAALERSAPGIRSPTPNEQTGDVDLRAELVFVGRIQAAFGHAKPGSVLALCAEHARRWPHGTFVQEREGLAAIAACQLGKSHAGARAQQFSLRYPLGPLTPRVREACQAPLEAAGF